MSRELPADRDKALAAIAAGWGPNRHGGSSRLLMHGERHREELPAAQQEADGTAGHRHHPMRESCTPRGRPRSASPTLG